MDNNIKKKSILMAIVIFMIGLLITGGTYAYLTIAVTVTNGNYVTNTHCFGVTYQNDDTSITGTLFPSGDAYGGITDWVSATADATCGLTGKGTLKIHVNSASTVLTGTVAAHCENENTLETQNSYTNQADCTAVSGNKWVTDGTALKYAVFSGDDLYSSGYIKSTDIGNDIIVHDNFSVTTTSKKFDVYVWLDGYLSDENYYDLDFSASSNMVVRQAKSTETYPGDTPIEENHLKSLRIEHVYDIYQRVEYIKSTGTQYIKTDIVPHNTTGIYAKISSQNVTGDYAFLGSRESTSTQSRFIVGNVRGKFYFGWNYLTDDVNRPAITVDTINEIKMNYLNDRRHVFNNSVVASNISSLVNITYAMYIFGGNYTGTINYKSSIMLYELKISDNDKIIADFVPVYRRSDSKPGLYDLVNGEFYTNAATSGNDFTFGPDVN